MLEKFCMFYLTLQFVFQNFILIVHDLISIFLFWCFAKESALQVSVIDIIGDSITLTSFSDSGSSSQDIFDYYSE